MAGGTTIQARLMGAFMGGLIPALSAVLVVTLGLGAILSGVSARYAEKKIRAHLVAKGRTLAGNNARALAGMAEQNAFLQMQELVGSTASEDPDVVRGLFVSADSLLPWVAASDRGGELVPADSLHDEGVAWLRGLRSAGFREVGEGRGRLLQFGVPVGESSAPLGWVRYDLAATAMDEAITEERRRLRFAFFALIPVLSGIGAATFVLARRHVRREAARLAHPIRELAQAAAMMRAGDYQCSVEATTDDEIGDLAKSFEAMRAALRIHTERLEEMVEEKVRQVRSILDNVDQAILVVEFDGTIAPERSRRAAEVLGTDRLGNIREALRLSPAQEADYLAWLALIRARSGELRWDKIVRLAPLAELEIRDEAGGERLVRMRYQTMLDREGRVGRVMLLAFDATEARRVERVVAAEKERHENEVRTILGLVNHLPEAVGDFLDDVSRRLEDGRGIVEYLLERSRSGRERFPDGDRFRPDPGQVALLARDLHTIKGSAATFGFEKLSRAAHRAEDILEDLHEPIRVRTSVTLEKLMAAFAEMGADFAEIQEARRRLSGGGRPHLLLPEPRVERIVALARGLQGGHRSEEVSELLLACLALRDQPLSRLVEKYRGQAERLGQRLGKKLVFECEPAGLELDPHFFGPLDGALVQILRNALDHGLEPPEVRRATGKPEVGRLRLALEIGEESVVLALSDDGRGVDLDRIVEKACRVGIVSREVGEAMGPQERLELLFAPGVSSVAEVSDLSGRGVGMSVVRTSVEALGGRVLVRSEAGRGTRIELRLPRGYGRT